MAAKIPLDIKEKYSKDATDYVSFYMECYLGMRAPDGRLAPTKKQANEFLTNVLDMFGLFDSTTDELSAESIELINLLEAKLEKKMLILNWRRAEAMKSMNRF